MTAARPPSGQQLGEISGYLYSEFEDGGGVLADVPVTAKYSLIKKLGKGSYGTVYLAEDSYQRNKKVAIKIVKANENSIREWSRYYFANLVVDRPEDSEALRPAMEEVKIMKSLKDEKGIVSLITYFAVDDGISQLAIVMEFCPNGNLEDYLMKNAQTNQYLDASHRKRWYVQLASAIQCIHSKGIVHRDLKPANILLDEGNNLKVADVGFAKALYEVKTKQHDGKDYVPSNVDSATTPKDFCDYMKSVKGTPEYMAPEIWDCIGYTAKACDVFSLGLIFLMIAEIPNPPTPSTHSGDCLGLCMNESALLSQGHLPIATDFLKLPEERKASDEEHKLFCDMLECKPRQRLNINDVLSRVQDLADPHAGQSLAAIAIVRHNT